MKYQETNQITGNRRWIALAAVMVTMFFSSLDQTIISSAMPTIIADLRGFDIYAWVFTAYMMTSAITVPIYGKLSDIYGRKPFYVFGLSVFMIGSALSGQAHTMMQLIFARGLQGLGGGAMMSMPRATIGDIFNPKERGKWMGLIMSVFGLASIIGPYLGGWITDNFNWRWVFYINLPVALISIIAVSYALPNVRTKEKHSIDWLGSAFMILALIPILLAFTWAGSKYQWTSKQIISLFAIGIMFMICFILIEKKAKEPLLSPSLFKNSIFTSTVLMGLLVSMSLFGTVMFLPLFVQGVVGLSASNSGALLTPMMLSFIAGSIVGGIIISKTGRYKLQAILGSIIVIIAVFLLSKMDVNTTWITVIRNMIILGLGLGTVMPLVNVVIQNAFPYKMLGVVNSTQQFVNSLGGIVIAPIYGTILANAFAKELPRNLPAKLLKAMNSMPKSVSSAISNPQALITAHAQEQIKTMFSAFGNAGLKLYNQFIHAVKLSLSTGITKLYSFGVVFAVLTLLAAFCLKEIPLKHDEFYDE
ncbi:hypothetical protein TR13x_00415 [Caloranaerobacter sp. TR13]|uniref:MDR family MFS transporter n=1 Tax=Caloranaerobacter sp. TR13 TaxID=1302151 RepID=UPI0006D3B370|nr:MDR family MFS transporter [Caloranaerobacter sp. TR13]KPU27858.1 hypothetical protein TR13x_00415 [Caloranaerobacter sp. TR13]